MGLEKYQKLDASKSAGDSTQSYHLLKEIVN